MNEETTVQGTGTTATEQEKETKTFTQAEVDAVVAKRLERERKKYPTEEEMTAYREWRGKQETEGDKLANMTKERDKAKIDLDAANAKIAALEQEKYIHSKGITGDEAEFIAFKAAKLVDDNTTFEQAVDKLTKDRDAKGTGKQQVDLGGNVGGGKSKMTKEEIMNIKDPAARQKVMFENKELFGIA